MNMNLVLISDLKKIKKKLIWVLFVIPVDFY